MSETLSRLARIHEFERLILAGTTEITSELLGLLPKRLRTLVVREISLQIDASEAEILEETLRVEQEVEHDPAATRLTHAGKIGAFLRY